VEGRRDLDAAPSTRSGPARAAEGSFAVDVARPGMPGHARRDAASQPVGSDAADRRSRHDIAVASRGRPPPLGRGSRAAAAPDVRRCTVMSGLWCCGRSVRMSRGVTAASTESSRRSASGWLRRRCGRSSRMPGSSRHRAGTALGGRRSCGRRRRGSWRWISSPLTCSTAPRSTSLPSSSTAPAAPDPRRHPAPGRILGRPAGPEPAHGPGRCRDAGEVRPA